jgi:tetratricopeptide (TPR) repeat protein
MLNAVGWYQILLGEHAAAIAHCEQALTLEEELGDPYGQAATWDSLGYAHHHLGNHGRAADCYERSLALQGGLVDRHRMADTLTRLGDTRHAGGDVEAARDAWQRALDILTDLEHLDAETVRAKLHRLTETTPAGRAGRGYDAR